MFTLATYLVDQNPLTHMGAMVPILRGATVRTRKVHTREGREAT